MPALLAIDQGTTSSRAILFDERGRRLAVAQRELQQHFPQAGWVEHDATRIWEDTLACVRDVLQNAALSAREVAAVGVTNQRETTVIWDRATGVPIHRAIVWQDRRTSEFCRQHQERGAWLAARTGLRLDPYFSATKIAWQLDHVDGARARAERGELAFGTIDSWLLWKLTGGRAHVTDATNASRTALFNLATQSWDDELLDFFGVPRTLLPEVLDSAADFGHTEPSLFGGSIAIGGVAGDQQAATDGQACFEPGMAKSTYGTGCFIVLNTGTQLKLSRNRLLSTVAYRLEGRPTYALEGSIFIAGAAVQWLRDSLHLISTAAETEQLAGSIDGSDGVYLVPAFTGLGAPYWDPDARGALLGLTRSTGIAVNARATLEAVAFPTRDLMGAMAEDALIPTELRVDGGMVVNNWLAQNLADMLQLPVVRPHTVETTALGAALLAGLTAGVFQSLEDISRLWEAERRFTPRMSRVAADRLQAGWLDAVRRVRSTSASH
jgi:glycerol kinase